jgi:hypothetical protein
LHQEFKVRKLNKMWGEMYKPGRYNIGAELYAIRNK